MRKHPWLIVLIPMIALLLIFRPWQPLDSLQAQQASPQLPSYTIVIHDTGTTATVVKATGGTLHSLVINNPGASAVISLFDLASASCTGTPSTNVKAIVTLPASGGLPGTLLYDAQFVNGICIQDVTASSDLTVTAF